MSLMSTIDRVGPTVQCITENHASKGRKTAPTWVLPKYMYEMVVRCLNTQYNTFDVRVERAHPPTCGPNIFMKGRCDVYIPNKNF